jgi:Holliday junction DNA helicase RuvB
VPPRSRAARAALPASKAPAVTVEVADRALRQLEVDSEGLDALDHRYLSCIARNYDGGPVGIETLSAALSEPRDALEEIVEPYLLQQGFIGRTPRGRVLTLRAYKHLGLTGPARAATPQIGLFDESTEEAPAGTEPGGKAGTG